jgi:hypothetical protein
MSLGKPDIGEQALSKAAEIGMKSQLDEAESLEVDLRTDPGKMLQGKLDSANIKGKGLVMQKDLRAEELDVQTNQIAVNPMKAAFGEVELTQPTDATAHVVLKEQDIERAFNAEYIQEKLRTQEIQLDGKPTKISTRNVKFRLPESGKVALDAEVFIPEKNETKQVSFTAVPQIDANGNRIRLEDVQYAEGKEVSPELTRALLDSAGELLDLRNFELQGMTLRLQRFDIQPGQLTLQADAHVQQFPGS